MKRMFEQRNFATRSWWFALGISALVGIAAVLAATARGAGISPDSTVYVSMARSMLNAVGFQFLLQSGGDFPPLYPFLLAVGGAVLGDPALAARYINAFFFGANIVLVGITLKVILPHAFWIPLLGAWLMLSGLVMLHIHAMAWSEPAFLFFGMCGMLLLARYLESGKIWQLFGAGAAMGLASLDRYIGITFGAAGVAALFFLQQSKLSRRLLTILIFAVFAFLPFSLRLFQQPTRRLLTFHLPTWEYLKMPLDIFVAWLVPAVIPPLEQIRPWIAAILLVALGGGLALAFMARTRQFTFREIIARVPDLFWIWVLFLLSYLAGNLAARIFIGPSLLLHERAMSPALVALLVIGLSTISFVHSSLGKNDARVRYALLALMLVAILFNFRVALGWVVRTRDNGLEYASKTWQASPILARVRELAPGTVIYSNGSDAIYFLAARAAIRLPNKVDKMNLIANQAYLEQLQKIGARMTEGRTVIVLIDRYPDRWYQPSEQDLLAVLPLRVISREADGVILR